MLSYCLRRVRSRGGGAAIAAIGFVALAGCGDAAGPAAYPQDFEAVGLPALVPVDGGGTADVRGARVRFTGADSVRQSVCVGNCFVGNGLPGTYGRDGERVVLAVGAVPDTGTLRGDTLRLRVHLEAWAGPEEWAGPAGGAATLTYVRRRAAAP